MPGALDNTADCAPEMANDPETGIGVGLETATTGVTGTGLEAIPVTVEVVEELTETVDPKASTEETATTSGA